MAATPAVDDFLAELSTQRRLLPHTATAYARDLARLTELAGAAELPSLTSHDIRGFVGLSRQCDVDRCLGLGRRLAFRRRLGANRRLGIGGRSGVLVRLDHGGLVGHRPSS